MSDTQSTSRELENHSPDSPVFSEAEEAWFAALEQQHKVPLSSEQYDVVRGFLRSADRPLVHAA